jgi:hypothetical protein
MLDLLHLSACWHPKLWPVYGSNWFKAKDVTALYGAFIFAFWQAAKGPGKQAQRLNLCRPIGLLPTISSHDDTSKAV